MTPRTPVLVRFPPALLARVDRMRGALNRHAFLIDLIERATASIPSAPQGSPPPADEGRAAVEAPDDEQTEESGGESSVPNLMAALEVSLGLPVPSDPEPAIEHEIVAGAETDMGGDTPSSNPMPESPPSTYEAGGWLDLEDALS